MTKDSQPATAEDALEALFRAEVASKAAVAALPEGQILDRIAALMASDKPVAEVAQRLVPLVGGLPNGSQTALAAANFCAIHAQIPLHIANRRRELATPKPATAPDAPPPRVA